MQSKQLVSGALCLAMLSLALVGCAPPSPSTDSTSSTPQPQVLEPVECTPAPCLPNEAVAAAESLVQEFVSAWDSRNADKYLSLFAEDAVIIDHSRQEEYLFKVSKTYMKTTMERGVTEYIVDSHLVSDDGRFAVLEGRVTDMIIDGKATTVPAATILEIQSGKIIKETLYYRGTTG